VLGSAEPSVQRFIAQELSSGDTFYDIGANVGFFTVIAARRVGPAGRVVAFEPVHSNAALLRRNLAANAFENAEIVEAAVGDRSGSVPFLSRTAVDGKVHPRGDTQVRMVRLDDLDLPAPDLVKIDAEGAEFDVLRGARALIERHRPTIVCELHRTVTAADAARQVEECLPRYRAEVLENFVGEFSRPHVVARPG